MLDCPNRPNIITRVPKNGRERRKRLRRRCDYERKGQRDVTLHENGAKWP